MNASWPWPLVVMLAIGIGVAFTGFVQLDAGEAVQWRNAAGVIAFLGGSGFALLAPLLWRDARRQRARERSRPVLGAHVLHRHL